MTVEFKLPSLGENVESGDVVKLLVQPDQVIAANDPVLELETDKAVLELPCPHAGRITAIHVTPGQTVRVGQVLLTIEPAGVPASDHQPAAEVEQPAAAGAEPLAPSTGDTARAAAVAGAAVVEPPPPPPGRAHAAAAPSSVGPLPAGPGVRRLARELGVDLSTVRGSGKRGRIRPEDVRAAAREPGAEPAIPAGASAAGALAERMLPPMKSGRPVLAERAVPPGAPDQDQWGPVRRERLSRIRQTIAAQMTKSAQTIPHVTNFDDADITRLDALRRDVPPDFLGEGVKLTLMPSILRAVALTLRQHPALNATLDEAQQEIIYKEYINLGVAVDTPRGLVVPVLRQVDQMGIIEIARRLAELAQRARRADFTIEELRGGTFTVSNLGAIGGTYSTPIINHPEVAILLVGRARWLPAVREGHVEPRLMLPLSLSYDHRLVDGAAAGRFLNDLIALLESPGRMMLLG